jgi:hypothetical protein
MKASIHAPLAKRRALVAVISVATLTTPAARAQTAEEFQQLKAAVQQMQKTIDSLNAKIADMEKAQRAPAPAPPPPPAPAATNALSASQSYKTIEKAAEGKPIGEKIQF